MIFRVKKLIRSNLKKEQRRTWNAYFERQKDAEENSDEDEEMETVVHASQSSSHRKSPRKSTTSSEDRIKLEQLEQQKADLKD